MNLALYLSRVRSSEVLGVTLLTLAGLACTFRHSLNASKDSILPLKKYLSLTTVFSPT